MRMSLVVRRLPQTTQRWTSSLWTRGRTMGALGLSWMAAIASVSWASVTARAEGRQICSGSRRYGGPRTCHPSW